MIGAWRWTGRWSSWPVRVGLAAAPVVGLVAALSGCAREPAAPQVSHTDLAVVDLTATPFPPVAGSSIRFQAVVVNEGMELVTDRSLTFYRDADDDRSWTGEEALGPAQPLGVMVPGDTAVVVARVDSLAAGDARLWAVLDPADDDPTDDQRELAISVVGEDELRIHMIDVGQGDAILVEFPGGPRILVDGGNPEAGPVVVSYLRTAEVNHLDLVINTHPDRDHYGGLTGVLRAIPVAALWRSCERGGGGQDLAEFNGVVDSLEQAGDLEVHLAAAGDSLRLEGTGPATGFVALNPAVAAAEPCDAEVRAFNDSSIVARVAFGQFTALLTGDLEAGGEALVVEREGPRLDADVVQVPHHGSEFSSTPGFIAAVSAEVALVSVGADNPYGHPSPDALSRWTAAGAEIHRTDEEGTLIVVSDGAGYRIVSGGSR